MESSWVNRSVGRMPSCGALISEGPSLYMSICEGGLVGGKIVQTLLLFVLTLFCTGLCCGRLFDKLKFVVLFNMVTLPLAFIILWFLFII